MEPSFVCINYKVYSGSILINVLKVSLFFLLLQRSEIFKLGVVLQFCSTMYYLVGVLILNSVFNFQTLSYLVLSIANTLKALLLLLL